MYYKEELFYPVFIVNYHKCDLVEFFNCILLIHTSPTFLISELDNKAQNLSMLSQKYKKDAAYLNMKSFYMKVTAGCIVFAVFVLYFWVF